MRSLHKQQGDMHLTMTNGQPLAPRICTKWYLHRHHHHHPGAYRPARRETCVMTSFRCFDKSYLNTFKLQSGTNKGDNHQFKEKRGQERPLRVSGSHQWPEDSLYRQPTTLQTAFGLSFEELASC